MCELNSPVSTAISVPVSIRGPSSHDGAEMFPLRAFFPRLLTAQPQLLKKIYCLELKKVDEHNNNKEVHLAKDSTSVT